VLWFLLRRRLLSALGGEVMKPGVVHGICAIVVRLIHTALLASIIVNVPSVLRVRIARLEDVASVRILRTGSRFQHADGRRWTLDPIAING
jgi:hypothetical protein